ncbi:hypothetical protein FRZ44_37980 [Hypericibacter terrae]|uniref:Uncharacterized protein n=1 Tax=Hypericibacter terrae TaxID=2602015 RepID=A0A5J6MMS1_9PROT|nr:hypothetical protein [Hypericibacter terrae]QEX18491.1 hypothetical protein FRZ44_37980 [Hypericibacter terrae]
MAIRELDTETLARAAKDYAAWFLRDEGRMNRDWVMLQFYNFTYKDEFDFLAAEIRQHLGPAALADFDDRIAKLRADHPRSDEVFHRLLEEKRPAGYMPKEG